MTVERLDTESIEETIELIENNWKTYSAAREDLKVSVDGLCEVWNSPKASDEFYESMKTASTLLLDVDDNLNKLVADLKNIKESFEEWDNHTYYDR